MLLPQQHEQHASIVKHIELQLANLSPFPEELLAQFALQKRFSALHLSATTPPAPCRYKTTSLPT
jgi:hypothetical protein